MHGQQNIKKSSLLCTPRSRTLQIQTKGRWRSGSCGESKSYKRNKPWSKILALQIECFTMG